ncbi:EAL domain-containing protein [Endozoicomonas arenosclerae]|uniref:EAL domain-containing protein n=1 Tax=Endozoicomonas arenosclerae TaxID=1633495 RepID=UPI000AB5F84C|nr:EAL domain-containing protein [Endozoicomonas arenosclerae]
MEQENRDTLRLLIVDASSEEAEALLNVYRDAGYPTRAHHITSMESLEEALSGNQKWDLMIISSVELPEGLTINLVLDRVDQQGRDIPSIVLSEHPEDEHLELFKLGVRSVIALDNDELLLLTSDREVEDLNTRRHYRRMSVALNESEKQRRNLLDDQVDAIIYISEGQVKYSNPAFNELVGLDEGTSLAGKSFTDLVAEKDRREVGDFLASIEDSGQALAAIQCPLLAAEGEVSVRAMVSPTSFDGRYTLSLLVRPQETEDAPEIEQEEVEVARPDSETHLYDREAFKEQLDVAMQRVVAGKDKFALVCITLDSLRALHAKGGKRVSQPYHKEVSTRLGLGLIEHKAASWSGDCVMVLVKAGDEKTVQTLSEQLLKEVTAESVMVGKNELPVKVSLGGVMLTDTSSDLKTQLVRARHAATLSQKQGGGKLSFYQKRKVNSVSSVEKHLAGMVSQALKNDDFKLMYQPVVSLKGSAEKHFEVQLHMVDVRGREHDSINFRNKLDKNALWSKVDRWQIIEAGKELMESTRSKDRIRLFMHLGGNAILEKEFLPWMGVALKAAGIPPSSVVIEISEQNIVRFNKQAPAFFKSVKELGYCTGVSEFGCSLNPMETIAPLELDYVKVDPSFTKDLTSESQGEELKEMIMALSEEGQKVVVPQVQSAVEMAPLWHTGVDFIQGDFLQEPSERMDFDFESEF